MTPNKVIKCNGGFLANNKRQYFLRSRYFIHSSERKEIFPVRDCIIMQSIQSIDSFYLLFVDISQTWDQMITFRLNQKYSIQTVSGKFICSHNSFHLVYERNLQDCKIVWQYWIMVWHVIANIVLCRDQSNIRKWGFDKWMHSFIITTTILRDVPLLS